MTPHGKLFDIGLTTRDAISNYANMKEDERERVGPAGGWASASEESNGNGSLMRILPVSIFTAGRATSELIEKSFEVSALTHAHIRSKLCCAYYSLLISAILRGHSFEGALIIASEELAPYVPDSEVSHLERILNRTVLDEKEESIQSGGYVVHTLEAALWVINRCDDYRTAALAAVNLGGDTDTTAAVTGGLAGALLGVEGIPEEWLANIVKIEEIKLLVARFADRLLSDSKQ